MEGRESAEVDCCETADRNRGYAEEEGVDIGDLVLSIREVEHDREQQWCNDAREHMCSKMKLRQLFFSAPPKVPTGRNLDGLSPSLP